MASVAEYLLRRIALIAANGALLSKLYQDISTPKISKFMMDFSMSVIMMIGFAFIHSPPLSNS